MLQDHGYGASASCGELIYAPAFTSTKLYCLVTEAHSCEQLVQGCYSNYYYYYYYYYYYNHFTALWILSRTIWLLLELSNVMDSYTHARFQSKPNSAIWNLKFGEHSFSHAPHPRQITTAVPHPHCMNLLTLQEALQMQRDHTMCHKYKQSHMKMLAIGKWHSKTLKVIAI